MPVFTILIATHWKDKQSNNTLLNNTKKMLRVFVRDAQGNEKPFLKSIVARTAQHRQ
jgi:hypothetical protein